MCIRDRTCNSTDSATNTSLPMLFFTAVFCSARIFILSTRSFPSFFCQTATLRTLSTIRCKSFFRYLNMSVPSVQAAIYAGPPRIPKGCGMRHAWNASLISVLLQHLFVKNTPEKGGCQATRCRLAFIMKKLFEKLCYCH